MLTLIMSIHSANAQLSISQAVIASTGSFSSTSKYSISSTGGEAVVASKTSNSITLTQGFHQPLSKSAITSLEQFGKDEFSILVYPNPTSDYISIEITKDSDINLQIEITDVLGKRCGEIKQIVQPKAYLVYQCSLNDYSPGLYFVKVSSANHQFHKTIRVQKL
jgi:hypothetical protein